MEGGGGHCGGAGSRSEFSGSWYGDDGEMGR